MRFLLGMLFQPCGEIWRQRHAQDAARLHNRTVTAAAAFEVHERVAGINAINQVLKRFSLSHGRGVSWAFIGSAVAAGAASNVPSLGVERDEPAMTPVEPHP
jgi:hypothetical protein